MKQENKKLIQNLKTKNLNLNKKLNTNWKYVKKKKKKLPDFSMVRITIWTFSKWMLLFIYLFFTNLLIMFV